MRITDRRRRHGIIAVTVLLAAVTLFLYVSYLGSAATDDQQTVRVGIYDNPPKVYLDKDGQPAGLFMDILRAIAANEKWSMEYVRCDWQNCLNMLAAGDIDLMPDVAYSNPRAETFDFHQIPVTHSWSVVLVPDSHAVTTLPELDGLRVAILAGSIQITPLARILDSYNLNYELLPYPSYTDAFAAVAEGEADAAVSNSYFASFYGKRHGLRETPFVFNPAALFFATPNGDPLGLLPSIDANIDRWRKDETSVYYEALKRAMVPLRPHGASQTLRWMLWGALALLALIAGWSLMLRWQVRHRTRQLRKTTQRLDHMLLASPVVLYQLSRENDGVRTLWVSHNVTRLLGFKASAFVSDNGWLTHIHPDDRSDVIARIGDPPADGNLVHEYRVIDANGKIRLIRDEMHFLPGDGSTGIEIVGSWNDLTESRKQAEKLSFLTHYDPLTRLANRTLLRERLVAAIREAKRANGKLAVLYVNIDRFKNINDSFGRPFGDIMLKEVAERLSRVTEDRNDLARVSGDGFVVALSRRASHRDAEDAAQAIIESVSKPMMLRDQNLVVTASVGISLFPDDGANSDADILLQHAEAAAYEAKRTGRNGYSIYASALSAGVAERLAMESDLRGAAPKNELLLHYQPQLAMAGDRIIGVEALVRWRHPLRGMVPPGEFIPVAEDMGIIDDIGRWVLEEACRQMMAWRAEGIAMPRVAVNLSMQQIEGATLLPLVRRVLKETGLDPASLELEVTESTIMGEPERSAEALQGLRDIGVELAIDDFGTGYSSLNYLKHLPINRLKIDQSFVRDIGRDSNNEAINRAIIGLARSLNLETVAEGIETEEQLEFLRRAGCDIGQGYLFSRPAAADDIGALWRTFATAESQQSGLS